ncbi:TauD/TfdA family dioxygenase [Pigmentiphaga soli]|uniref:TauD/TfdA family dioxygenase n=1 Tax=Pigmentiphaga soli TaxID=1007095 RepID=A0ABP8GH89_9BURK
MAVPDRIRVSKLTPHIGAEIAGVDLTGPLAPDAVRAIEQALWDNLVVFFRDQPMTFEQHVRLGQYFGELYVHPAAAAAARAKAAAKATGGGDGKAAPNAYTSTVDGHPEILKIYADEHSSQVAGEDWHSDVTSETEPPMGSILRIEEPPPCGGDTLFASMYAAYDALSEPMKALLSPLTAIHDGMKVYGSRSAFDHTRTYPQSEHPIVRTHPVTGRQALFVSRTFTTRIVQLPKGESDALLQFLFAHVEQPLFQCRFRWQKNSVAFWDNRCTQHQALWDYFPNRRVGYRIQLAGDRPFHQA